MPSNIECREDVTGFPFSTHNLIFHFLEYRVGIPCFQPDVSLASTSRSYHKIFRFENSLLDYTW